MPSVEIITHTREDGSLVLEADITALPDTIEADEVTGDGRRVRYFDFGVLGDDDIAPADAPAVVAAQLRAELPVPAVEPPQTTTVEL